MKEYTIDEIVELIIDYRGKTPKKLGMEWTEDKGDIVALSAKNIKNGKLINLDKAHYGDEALYNLWMKDGDIECGDILLTSEAPLGEAFLITDKIKAILSQRVFLLRPNRNIVDPWYLYALIQTEKFKEGLNIRATGTTVSGIRQKELRKLRVSLPSLDEQIRISKKIKVLTRKIEINEKINANLLELSKVIFNRLQTTASTQTKLSNVIDIQNGYAFKSTEYIDSKELLVLRAKNIGNNALFNKTDVQYISKNKYIKYSKFEFQKFDTVLVMVGATIGKTGIITSNVLPAFQNQNLWRFRSKKNTLPGLYIYEIVNMINNSVKSSASGSARAFYRKKLFSEFEIPLFSEEEYTIFKNIEHSINELACENDTLNSVKISLLAKLLN